MNRAEALYFMEGLTAALASPSPVLVKRLFLILADIYGITREEMDAIRAEIDVYIEQAEAAHERVPRLRR